MTSSPVRFIAIPSSRTLTRSRGWSLPAHPVLRSRKFLEGQVEDFDSGRRHHTVVSPAQSEDGLGTDFLRAARAKEEEFNARRRDRIASADAIEVEVHYFISLYTR